MKCKTALEVSYYIDSCLKNDYHSDTVADAILISKIGMIELDSVVVGWIWADKREFVEVTITRSKTK